MKSFLTFLAGMLITVLLVGAGVFFLFRPASTEQVKPGEFIEARLIEPSDRFMISGTITVPDELNKSIQSGKGRLGVFLSSGPQNLPLVRLIADLAHPTFPYHLEVALSKSSLTLNPRIKTGLSIFFAYSVNDTAPKWLAGVYFEPTAIGGKNFPFSESEILEGKLPPSYDLGSMPFSRYYPYAVSSPCVKNKVTLAGRITPSAEFQQKYGKDKFALVLYEESILGRTGQAPERQNKIAHSQFISFSSGPVLFSIPPLQAPFPYFALFAQKCENGESLQSCAHRAVPVRPFVDQNKNRFNISSAKYLAPRCGVADFEGIIDKTTYEMAHPWEHKE